MKKYEKLLFTEMRTIQYSHKLNTPITNELLQKSVTVNENLRSLGFTLNINDIIKLATSNELETIYENIKSFTPNITANPMYPNFPTQVMSMDEATFRFHQFVHYFSTYGIEEMFGVEVSKGWLPNVEDTEKTVDDKIILKEKVLSLATDIEVENLIVNLLAKKERFTLTEIQLVQLFMIETDFLSRVEKLNITFKENIQWLVDNDFVSTNNYIMRKATLILKKASKHTGDVLDCIWYMIERNNYKQFRTSQKRVLVEVLESFNINDFKENLALKRERNLTILRYISYSRFTKSYNHLSAVSSLRNKELKTWNSQVEYMISKANSSYDEYDVLEFVSQRSGMLLRMVARFVRLGYDVEDIEACLSTQSEKLKTQTIVATLNKFIAMTDKEYLDKKNKPIEPTKLLEIHNVIGILKNVLETNLFSKLTPLIDKKVYIDETMFNFEQSIIETNEKFEDGGYIKSGLAIKIPEEIERLRFFVYWNDKKRIDIDLHSDLTMNDGHMEHVGWNSNRKFGGVMTSGDITHSDASEYIDINFKESLKSGINKVNCRLNSCTLAPFKEIETVFTGMIAVNNIETNVKLYNNVNVFFRHDLNSSEDSLNYCEIDIENKALKIIGQNGSTIGLSLKYYVQKLLEMQNSIVVQSKEEADIVLSLDKTTDENNISLIDSNYFMDI